MLCEALFVVKFFSKFFIVKQQKPKALIFPESCCSHYVVLTILITLVLNVLRACSAHAISTFAGFKVSVYGMKGVRLWYEKWRKVSVYGMKGVRLWYEKW